MKLFNVVVMLGSVFFAFGCAHAPSLVAPLQPPQVLPAIAPAAVCSAAASDAPYDDFSIP
jgi:hypothetical protein